MKTLILIIGIGVASSFCSSVQAQCAGGVCPARPPVLKRAFESAREVTKERPRLLQRLFRDVTVERKVSRRRRIARR